MGVPLGGEAGQILAKASDDDFDTEWVDAPTGGGGGGGGAVDSVNGQTGLVVLDSDDISEGATNLYFTNERAQDAVGSALSAAGEGVDLTYNDGANTITANLDLPGLGSTASTQGVDLILIYDYSLSQHRVITVDDFIAGKGITDELVKASSADTTGGYLSTKIKVGPGLVSEVSNPSGDEDFNIDLDPSIVFDKGNDNSDAISEGSTNIFFSDARVMSAIKSTYAGTKSANISVTAPTDNVATGDGKAYITIPQACNGMNLIRATATVVTAGTTGASTVQVRNVTQAADMLSGLISIASGGTVATAGTIDTSNDDVATDDVIAIDVDSVSSTPPKGLTVILEFRLP